MSKGIRFTIIFAAVFSATLLFLEGVNALMGAKTSNKGIASAITVYYWVTDPAMEKEEKGDKDETGRMQSNDRKNIL